MQLHELPDEGEAQAETAERARIRAVPLAEAVKHVGKKCRLDAHAGVRDGDLRCSTRLHQPNLHAAPLGRELQGIGQQVPQDLLQASRVAQNRADRLDVGLQLDVFYATAPLESDTASTSKSPQLQGRSRDRNI